ncbi:hypothetical protein F4777DRAFT_542357 [Nemania sp. FL0916]|nr:hypothetical protein F4777DRAFT_542357 [Nemania sp. FL0916]
MAEAFGTVASALAVAELSIKVVRQCKRYYEGVKNADDNIERVIHEVQSMQTVLEALNDLLDSPQGAKLKTSPKLYDALMFGRIQLENLSKELEPSNTGRLMRRVHIRALKWPFKRDEVNERLLHLARCTQSLTSVLQIDETQAVLRIEENIVNSDQRAVLDKLPVASGAAFDSYAEEHNSKCLPQTREKTLSDIHGWVENPDAKTVFWLNGMAGTGKSTISRTLARSFGEDGRLGATFFFKRGEGDRGTASKLFTTIAAQLVQQDATLAWYVRDVIENNPAVLDGALRKQFQKLISEPLSKVSLSSQGDKILVIVIDALDECESETDIEDIIDILSHVNTMRGVRLRVFLTSRPELPTRLGFYRAQGEYDTLILHEIEEVIIEHDLSIFFRHELASIAERHNKQHPAHQFLMPWPGEPEIEILINMATPLFIFAATACRFIADRRTGPPDVKLKRILQHRTKSQESKLDATYLPVLEQLLFDLTRSEQDEVLELFKRVVGSIVLLEFPLSVQALAQLLDMPENEINNHLDYLHSVLNVPSSPKLPVRLLHLSFRDFLTDPLKCGKNPFWIDEKESHWQLATYCIRVMEEELHQDMCELRWPATSTASINPKTISNKLSPTVQYACHYWVSHVEQSWRPLVDDDQVHRFLQKHFLHWLEALSLIKMTSEFKPNLITLSTLCHRVASQQLTKFINDALTLPEDGITRTKVAPLQAYCSLLVFAPENNIIRDIFRDDMPKWVLLYPRIGTTSHSRPVVSTVFSPDGALVASCSHDHTARLWSVATGECLQTLRGHSKSVNKVVFSPDSSFVASCSPDRTVRLWSVNTGECLQILEGHSDAVVSTVFSSDSTLVMSSSTDCTIRLWLVATGECLQIFEGHYSTVESVAFSPNCLLAASGGVRDNTFDHTYQIAMGTHHVGGNTDGSVRIWSITKGGCLQVLLGHSGCVRSIIFSPDSALVASSSCDFTVRLWSVATGKCIRTLEGHSRAVTSVVFSPDGALIAAGSDEGTIRLWSVDTGNFLQSIYVGTVLDRLSFSQDCQHLVTNTGVVSLSRLVSPTVGSIARSLPGHDRDYHLGYMMTPLYFAPDNNTFFTRVAYGGRYLLLLPEEAQQSTFGVFGHTIVCGSRKGKVWIMRFSESLLEHW